MERNYVAHVRGESSRPTLDRAGFHAGLEEFVDEISNMYVHLASIEPKGPEVIAPALAELSERAMVYAKTLKPRTAPHNISNLLSILESTPTILFTPESLSQIQSMDDLNSYIVHSLDRLDEILNQSNLLFGSGSQEIKKISRQSKFYRNIDVEEDIKV